MKHALIVGYVVIALLFGTWFDTMDRRFGVRSGEPAPFVQSIFIAIVWPITLPVALITMVCCDGRWKFATLHIQERKEGT